MQKSEIKVLCHHLQQPPAHEADKEAGASVCFQEVRIVNRTCWLVVTLGEEEKKKKKQAFHFSLGSVVKITCTSTSLVNFEAFSDSFLENLIDECSHCKLLSKSTI